MDPGTALGVVSLTFQLFGGCIQGFILLSAARNAGKVGTSLLCQLSIQELRLTEWAARAGLLGSGKLDLRLNQTVVENVLLQLRDLLSDVDKLSKRYKLKLAIPPENYAEDPNQKTDVLGIAISDETRRDVLWRAKLIHDRNMLPKRLWWAAVDREKFQEVRLYVQELWSLLDPLTQDDMLRSQQLILANVISLTDKLEDVKTLRDAFSSTEALADQLSRLMPLANIASVKVARIEGEETLSDSEEAPVGSVGGLKSESAQNLKLSENLDLALKAKSLTIEDTTGSLQDVSDEQISHFRPLTSKGDLGIASYGTTPVLVEWKHIPSMNRWKLIKRVQQLARVLHVPTPPIFRSLQCQALAMSDDATKTGFVFRLPHDHAHHALSLREILSGKLGITAPSVGSRISLALAITQSIQYFHTAGWMHKNLRSENILFFRETTIVTQTVLEEELEAPFIVGFGYARLDATNEISERPSTDPSRDIYRHPHALEGVSVSYQPFMDLYSLGTILVELAEWRPLSSLVKTVVDVKSQNVVPLTQLAAVRSYLCDASLDGNATVKLDFRMGRRYARAVRLCLGAETIDGKKLSRGRTTAEGEDCLGVLHAAIEELRACVI